MFQGSPFHQIHGTPGMKQAKVSYFLIRAKQQYFNVLQLMFLEGRSLRFHGKLWTRPDTLCFGNKRPNLLLRIADWPSDLHTIVINPVNIWRCSVFSRNKLSTEVVLWIILPETTALQIAVMTHLFGGWRPNVNWKSFDFKQSGHKSTLMSPFNQTLSLKDHNPSQILCTAI